MKTLLERMNPDKLQLFRERTEDYPSTRERIEQTLTQLHFVDELSYGYAKRLAEDTDTDLKYLLTQLFTEA